MILVLNMDGIPEPTENWFQILQRVWKSSDPLSSGEPLAIVLAVCLLTFLFRKRLNLNGPQTLGGDRTLDQVRREQYYHENDSEDSSSSTSSDDEAKDGESVNAKESVKANESGADEECSKVNEESKNENTLQQTTSSSFLSPE